MLSLSGTCCSEGSHRQSVMSSLSLEPPPQNWSRGVAVVGDSTRMPVNRVALPPPAASVSQSSGRLAPPFGGTESIAFRSSSKRSRSWTAWVSCPPMMSTPSAATARASTTTARTGCRAIVAKLLDMVKPPSGNRRPDRRGAC